MIVKILFFGITSDLTNTAEYALQLHKNATVKECKEALQQTFPAIKQMQSYAIAVNESYATDAVLLKTGDVVAVIPPVSGG